MEEVYIYWSDLDEEVQDRIAELLNIPTDQVEDAMNWEYVPMFIYVAP